MKKIECELTREGLEKLKARRDNHIAKLREIIAQMEEIALSEDTSENMEYRQLRREMMNTREEIDRLEMVIQNAKVITKTQFSKAEPGCHLKLENHQLCCMFQLVSSMEANSLSGKVSCSSPLGQSLLGKRVGDEIIAMTPIGNITFNIVSIM